MKNRKEGRSKAKGFEIYATPAKKSTCVNAKSRELKVNICRTCSAQLDF
jgi:hypothetical protein